MRASLIAIAFLGIVLAAAGVARNALWPAAYAGNPAAEPQHAAAPGANPVIVELFTSEGCSSCPPADRLLAHLERTQPVSGAEIIALEEHVDYWNSDGWIDPFSSPQFTSRQDDYAHSFRTSGPYTPQMVVDGEAQFVGSNERAALEAVVKAAQSPGAPVQIAQPPDSGADARNIHLHVQVGPVSGWQGKDKADVLLAITEENLSSNVTAGENSGNRLGHSSVVRELRVIGKLDAAGSFAADPDVHLGKDWKRENLNAVVFVQAHSNRKVLGASVVRLAFPAQSS